jgi:hypothetical protein
MAITALFLIVKLKYLELKRKIPEIIPLNTQGLYLSSLIKPSFAGKSRNNCGP